MDYQVNGYNDSKVKEICYNCNSKTAKASYNYFRRIAYVSAPLHHLPLLDSAKGAYKVWCKVWCKGDKPVAFFYAVRCRDHVRLIEIAVHRDYQRQGIGRMALYDLLTAMKSVGLNTLTFRTPMNEDAQHFWLKIGASIVDVKDNDYVMQIKIK